MKATAPMPLDGRPRLVNCGLAHHGMNGREEYLLPKLWCLHLYFYAVDLEIGRQRFAVVPGAVTVVPPGRKIVFRYGSQRCRHFFVHFRLPSQKGAVRMPLFQHLPEARDELLDRLQRIQAVATRQSFHAEVLLWGLLWDLTRGPEGHRAADELPLIEKIEEEIEARLPEPLTVEALAEALQLSTTHLNRAVKRSHGCTTVQLIRKRRLRRAYRFLVHSTMPIKLAAAESGIGDLQTFNKLIRKEYGKGPRLLRESYQQKSEADTWALDRE